MTKEVDAVVLAGGRGKRMGNLTTETQKCLLCIEGKPVIAYVLDSICDAFGSARVVITTGHHGKKVKETLGNTYRSLTIDYVHDPRALETRRRLLLSKDLLHGPFLITAGDVVCKSEQMVKLAELYERDKSVGVVGALSVSPLHANALTHALIRTENSRVVGLTYPPTSTWTEHQLREMGIAYYDQRFLTIASEAPEDVTFLSQVIKYALQQGNLFEAEKYSRAWYHFVQSSDLDTHITFE